MPIIDMPLEELRRYGGTNPCPPDIDEYWDSALAEMKAVQPDTELVPASFQAPGAECFELYFTGVGGSRIHAKYLRPKNIQNPVPALLFFHGYSLSSGDWLEKLAYVNSGFAVAAMDCRGQGGWSEDLSAVKGPTLQGHIIRGAQTDSPQDLLYRQIFLDTAQLAGIVMGFDEVDGTRVGALGESQGGALTVACAALEPRIRMAAPQMPFLSDYQRVWEMDLAQDAYVEMKQYFMRFDPTHEKEREFFERLGYIDIQNLAKRIKAEVLWGIGLMDTVCPPSTQFAVYNKITSPKQMVVYPDFAHEHYPGFWDKALQFFIEGLL